MAVDVLVPPLSQTMDTVVLAEWLKAVGDAVAKGEPLFIIETDKANIEIESPATGILRQVLALPGAEVQVRSRIGLIGNPDEIISDLPGDQELAGPETTGLPATEALPIPHPLATATGPGGQPLPPERQDRIFASPRARRLAHQTGVPLVSVKATGPQHMVVERDVEAYLAQQQTTPPATPVARRMAQEAGLDLATVTPERSGARVTRTDVASVLSQQADMAPAAGRWVDLSPTRQTIARRMVQSQQAAAHVTLTREVDATELVRLREQILQELLAEDPRPTYTDFLVSIAARQLRQHPYVNATADGGRFALSEAIHIGVAVDTERGLMVPVVRHVDRKGLLELTQERLELRERVLDGTVTPAELSGGTFTLTNLGVFGVDAFTPIINPPQVAILGVGRIRAGSAVYQGELCIRQLMVLSLTFDHRLIDGAPAARFLADIARFIEKPFLRWL